MWEQALVAVNVHTLHTGPETIHPECCKKSGQKFSTLVPCKNALQGLADAYLKLQESNFKLDRVGIFQRYTQC